MKIAEAQTLCLEYNIPFYCYRLPGGKDFFWGAQICGEVEGFQGMEVVQGVDGFVVVPFRESHEIPALFIRRDLGFVNYTENEELPVLLKNNRRMPATPRIPVPGVSQEQYHGQVTTMISALRQKVVSKMVLSRSLLVECEAFRKIPEWFEKLAESYPDAFVFLVSVPGVMTWMGATPETFLRQGEQGAGTMALAGTRPYGEKASWGEKEIEEQQIVSHYINGLLQEYGVWEVTGPFSKQAGNVEHLCTCFTCHRMLPSDVVEQVRRRLHPTPAVGGFPTGEAVKLLEKIEGYERRYYAGYLGPVGQDMTFDWFVNLRCMEVFQQAVCLYVGGGITALSDPVKEWEETELKSRTLLDIIGS